MKKLATGFSLIAGIFIFIFVSGLGIESIFASDNTFKIVETTPENKQENTAIDNQCVKIYFDKDTSFAKSLKGQEDLFVIKNAKDKQLPVKVIYTEKNDKHYILVATDTLKIGDNKELAVEGDADYTFTLSKNLTDDKGRKMEIDQENQDANGDFAISFKTLNQSRTMTINMIMMAVMFVGIFVISSRSMKKQQREEAEAKQKSKKINPYDEAKRTGKSVEEIVAKQNKEKEKKAATLAKMEEEKRRAEEKERERATTFKVKELPPIKEVGGKYKTKPVKTEKKED